jgi:hypothetical protein
MPGSANKALVKIVGLALSVQRLAQVNASSARLASTTTHSVKRHVGFVPTALSQQVLPHLCVMLAHPGNLQRCLVDKSAPSVQSGGRRQRLAKASVGYAHRETWPNRRAPQSVVLALLAAMALSRKLPLACNANRASRPTHQVPRCVQIVSLGILPQLPAFCFAQRAQWVRLPEKQRPPHARCAMQAPFNQQKRVARVNRALLASTLLCLVRPRAPCAASVGSVWDL